MESSDKWRRDDSRCDLNETNVLEKPSVNEIEVMLLAHLTEAEGDMIEVEKSDENIKVSGKSDTGESANIDASASTRLKDRRILRGPNK